MKPYATLGVAKDASAAEIKAAYRSLAQKHHPDKDGGDKATFQSIQEAYAILSDDDQRAEYDATGTVRGSGPSLRDEAMGLIAAVMEDALEQADPDHDNILSCMEDMIKGGLMKLAEQTANVEGKRAGILKAIKRTKAKDGKANSVGQVLDHMAATLDRELKKGAFYKAKCELALAILRDHSYTVEVRPVRAPRSGSMWGGFQNQGGLNV